MNRWLAKITILLMLGTTALAQDYPIEVELVPVGAHPVVEPDDSYEIWEFQEEVVVAPRRKRALTPRLCLVCEHETLPGQCPCYELLTQKMAESLWREVKATMNTTADLRLSRPVRVFAVSRKRLRQLGGERLLGLYEDDVIYVNHELTRREARGVIAHEFGHAWFFQRRTDVNSASDLLFEGFPEFLSYLMLTEAGDRKLANRIAYQDQSVYGRGARKLIALYQRSGIQAVVGLALNSDKI